MLFARALDAWCRKGGAEPSRWAGAGKGIALSLLLFHCPQVTHHARRHFFRLTQEKRGRAAEVEEGEEDEAGLAGEGGAGRTVNNPGRLLKRRREAKGEVEAALREPVMVGVNLLPGSARAPWAPGLPWQSVGPRRGAHRAPEP